jgi:glycosyltransferase involved in cell wall biosynthesis
MGISFDLTDVAAHAVFNDFLTGIQRVQIEYAKSFARLQSPNVRFFTNIQEYYVDENKLFAEGGSSSAAAIFSRFRNLYGFPLPGKRSQASHGDIRANARLKLQLARHALTRTGKTLNAFLGKNDVLYVGGAFWAHKRAVQTYERAARAGVDVAVLFHDFIPLTFPDYASGRARLLFERMLRLPARSITISRYTQSQLHEARRAIGAPDQFPAASVVPLAHEFSNAPRNHAAAHAPTARLAALRSLEPFALYVGTIEVRKNHGPLLQLWESLAREAGGAWPKLILAGKRGWKAEEALGKLRRAKRESPYLWIDSPTDDELAWLYGHAKFTVFPSFVEGWGLPVGESLWFGKPCVASNTTSIPEVGGSLCSYGDPCDISSFGPPIIRLVRDPDFYAASVAAIKASPLRTWSDAASDMIACLTGPRQRHTARRHGPMAWRADETREDVLP